MRVGVVDHGMGNLRSVAKALEAAGAAVTVSADRRELEGQEALCVPGQGIFGRAVTNLDAAGLAGSIAAWIGDDRPFLGICLGLQILFDESDERGPVGGLGILPGRVVRLRGGPGVPVPHIGWNTVLADLDPGPGGADGDPPYFYFDHSYAVEPADRSIVAGWCDHGGRFCAAVRRRSILGVQFHPEKSGAAGIDLLRGWLDGATRSF
ncbi:MAG: imidazole glycerol phosphate synthase subunit HisH [Actinomycetota bacterium]